MSVRVRQRAKKYSLHYAKNCGVRADAKGQREDRDGGKTRAFAKHSHAVPQILRQLVGKADAASFPALLFHALDPAKLDSRSAHRFLTRSPATHQILGELLDMKTQLRIHFAFHSGTTKNCSRPRTKPARKRHTSSALMFTIPTIFRVVIRASTPSWDRRAWHGALGCSRPRA